MTGTAVPGEMSGAEFRQKFEAMQAERDSALLVSRQLAASAFKGVKPEDFEGVEPNKYVEHAQKISAARAAEREALFAEMAKEKGIDVSALAQGNANATPQAGAQSRIASAGELSGTPPNLRPSNEGLTGRALLEAHYAAQEG